MKESRTGGAGAGVVDADWIKNDRFAFIQLSHCVSHLLSPVRRATPVKRAYRVYWCLDVCLCEVRFVLVRFMKDS